MNTKENVLCEERKEKERESGGVGEYKYGMKLVRAVAVLAAALPKRRERWWREDDDHSGYSGVFGLRPMSGVGFVTLSGSCVCEVDYSLLLPFVFVKTFYSLQ